MAHLAGKKGLMLVLFSLFGGFVGTVLASQSFGAALAKFGFGLMQQTIQQPDPPKNLAFSPHSIAKAFADMYPVFGAITREEVDSVFGFNGSTLEELGEVNTILTSSPNFAFVESKWFLESSSPISSTLSATAMAKIDLANFSEDPEAARSDINHLFFLLSDGHVPEILPSGSVTHWTKLLLANAISIKGNWSIPFDGNHTRLGHFTGLEGHVENATFMCFYEKTVYFKSLDALNATAIELQYDDNVHSLLVVAPNSVEDFRGVQKHISSPDAFQSFIEGYKLVKIHKLCLPKLKIDTQMHDLKQSLVSMNLSSIFDPFLADLDLLEDDKVAVDSMHHRAIVTIDESGRDADTSNITGSVPSIPQRLEVAIDKPFVYFIVNRDTQTTLIMGYFTSTKV